MSAFPIWLSPRLILLLSITQGTYHTYPNSVAQKQHGAFTLRQFLDANTPHAPVYLGGKLSYDDSALSREYEMVPEGMVSRFVPVKSGSGGVSSVNNVAVAGDVTAQRYVNNTHSGKQVFFAWCEVLHLFILATSNPGMVRLSPYILSVQTPLCSSLHSQHSPSPGWEEVSARLSIRNLPDPVQFPMETWEWTIGRDYRDRLAGIVSRAMCFV